MRKYIFVFILTFLLLAITIEAQTKSAPIFRTINVGIIGESKISLGDDVLKVQRLLLKTETGYTLKPHAFGGAKTINILISKANRIRAMFFEYGADKDFEEAVASYTQSLGKPSAQQSLVSQALEAKVIIWEDAETRFELVKRTEQEGTLIFSALFDKKGVDK